MATLHYIALKGHSTKLPGHEKGRRPFTNNEIQQSYSIEQIDDIKPNDSASQVSNTPIPLSNILKEFEQKIHNQTLEFEKYLKAPTKMINSELNLNWRNAPMTRAH